MCIRDEKRKEFWEMCKNVVSMLGYNCNTPYVYIAQYIYIYIMYVCIYYINVLHNIYYI